MAAWRSATDRNTPRFSRRLVSIAKNPSTGVEPGRRSWGEVESPAGVASKPLTHLGMFVGRIIVDDGVDHFSHRDLLLDRLDGAACCGR